MKRIMFMVAAVAAALSGAALAVIGDRRSRLDEAYEEDPTWVSEPAGAPAGPVPAPEADPAEGSEATVSTDEEQSEQAGNAASEPAPEQPANAASNSAASAAVRRRRRPTAQRVKPAA